MMFCWSFLSSFFLYTSLLSRSLTLSCFQTLLNTPVSHLSGSQNASRTCSLKAAMFFSQPRGEELSASLAPCLHKCAAATLSDWCFWHAFVIPIQKQPRFLPAYYTWKPCALKLSHPNVCLLTQSMHKKLNIPQFCNQNNVLIKCLSTQDTFTT